MTLLERSLFSFWLSLGEGRGFLGWRVARVEKCLNYVRRCGNCREGGRFKVGRREVCEIWG